ncbi:uncharacterized protein K02A2.6-like [Gigantopelta aegis]|uniref:uncharacterized protein K02A2.6-like n=1 Tax=Gigantopelta aegis TaxID=1735272 RepID=UPI001B888600|nr:uncharacterized protein K02A2.6-like [Gigantopelta aegis]
MQWFASRVRFHKGQVSQGTFYIVQSGTSLLGKDIIQTLDIGIHGGSLTCFATRGNASSDEPTSDSVSIPDRFPQLFSDKIGKVKGFKHKIKVRSDVKPVQQKLRRLPFAVRNAVSAELKKLENSDIIERIDASEWISPIVVAWKKDGSVRVCVDLRKPNEAIIEDRYPLPNIDEMISEMHGATHFSKLDLKSAYHQLELVESSRDLTAFITHEGLFRFKRVCFGLSSAPSCFQKMMSTILCNVPGVQCFIDDVIVYGRTKAEHDRNLNLVLQRLTDAGLTLNDKCEFNVPSLTVLGHVISKDGVRPNPDLVKAISDAPVPTNKDQLRSVLGLCGYYSKFVPNFAARVQPMRCIQTAEKFKWTEEANKAFKDIKSAIVNSPALALFDPYLDIIVTTDASGYGLGATLTQVKNGSEVIVACASRSLTALELKYSVGEREALACVWAVEKWHTYLWGRRFTLRTDHQALVTLLSSKGTGHKPMRIARWAMRLLHYTYDIQYKPGVQNKVPDALSRLPLSTSKDKIQDEDEAEAVCQLWFEHVEHNIAITRERLQRATSESSICTRISQYIQNGWPCTKTEIINDLKPFFQVKDELSVHDGIIFRGERVIVPDELCAHVWNLAHESHQGIVRTKQRLRDLYWWPKMDIQVTELVKSCITCQLNDKSAVTRTAPTQPVPLPNAAWKKLGLDFVGPDYSAPPERRYIISMIDYRSKWPEVAFASDISTKTVLKFLVTVFSREGYPDEIVTDNGPQVVSHEFEEFLRHRNIKHRFSSVYHPEGNSEVERLNKILSETIQSARIQKKDVKSTMVQFLGAYRATKHATTGESPSFMLHGRHMRTMLDIKGVTLYPNPSTSTEVENRVAAKQAKSKAYADKRKGTKARFFKPGDYVRIRKPWHVKKGESKFTAPIKIVSQISPFTYKMENGSNWNVKFLAPFYGKVPNQFDEGEDVWFETQVHNHFEQNHNPNIPQRVREPRVRRLPAWTKDYVMK